MYVCTYIHLCMPVARPADTHMHTQILLLEGGGHTETYGHVPDPDLIRKLARACNGELLRCGGDSFVHDPPAAGGVSLKNKKVGDTQKQKNGHDPSGVLHVQRAVLSRTTYLGPNADWAEFW